MKSGNAATSAKSATSCKGFKRKVSSVFKAKKFSLSTSLSEEFFSEENSWALSLIALLVRFFVTEKAKPKTNVRHKISAVIL